VGSMTVNQQGSPLNQSPEPNDRPWTRLGVWNVNAGDTLTVELSDPNAPSGDRLCVGDAMIHPLWPTVDIQQTGVTVPSQVSTLGTAAASDYVDWYDAANPASIPVEGSGSRTEFVLTAAVDPLFAQAPPYSGAPWNWTAKMPAASGLEYWSASQNGSAWQPQPIAPGSTYTSDVWASTNPSATLPAGTFPITFKVCAPPGAGDAATSTSAPAATGFTPVGSFTISIAPFFGPGYDPIWNTQATVTWMPPRPGTPAAALAGLAGDKVRLFQRVLTQEKFSWWPGPMEGAWNDDEPGLITAGSLTDWSAAPPGGKVVYAAQGVPGQSLVEAKIVDTPGTSTGKRLPGMTYLAQFGQDAAVCMTKGPNYGRVLGWVNWSVQCFWSASGDYRIQVAPLPPCKYLKITRATVGGAGVKVDWPGPPLSAPGAQPPKDFPSIFRGKPASPTTTMWW
ncbi:MAG: hypothetical protein ABSG86_32430, partial [Thermoguttaceae bacterium]